MQVLLGGRDSGVAKAFLDDLEVGAAVEKPGRVGVAKAVWRDVKTEPGAGDCVGPDVAAEPVTADVTVCVHCSWCARLVLARGAAGGSVCGDAVAAMLATTSAGAVSGWGAVPVASSRPVGFGPAERRRVG